MAHRSKPYTVLKFLFDVVLFLIVGPVYLIVRAFWEMYRFFGPRKK